MDYPNSAEIVFSGQNDTTLKLTVTTPAGCKGSDDLSVVVHQGNFATLHPAPDTGEMSKGHCFYACNRCWS